MTVRAIYENGVFRPTEPVALPDKTEVEIEGIRIKRTAMDDAAPVQSQVDKDILEILSRSYRTGRTDAAARHNEHQS